MATVTISACTPTAGRDFVDSRSSLVVGKSTLSDVESVYGQPFEDRKTSTTAAAQNPDFIAKLSPFSAYPVNGEIEVINYFYRRGQNYKKMGMNFHDGVLFEYTMGANFPAVSTDFDDSKVSLLVKGKTTKPEILAMFGPPSGEAIYPGVRDNGNTKLRFYFQPPLGPTRSEKRLEAIFNPAGVLIDYQFQSSSAPAPTPVATGPSVITVPIFTPHK